MVVKNVDHNGTFKVENTKKVKPLNTMEQWLTAFTIYMTIYSTKFPNEHVAMLKYMASIRKIEAARTGNAWKFYDIKFRKYRHKHYQPWDLLNQDLLTEVTILAPHTHLQQGSGSFQNSKKRGQATTKKLSFPAGYCYAYQIHGVCNKTGCTFTHSCHKCSGKHASTKCTKTKAKGSPNAPNTNNSK